MPISFATPAKIEAGKQYALVLSAAGSTPDGSIFVAWRYDAGSSLQDRTGTPCANGAYGAGRAFGKGTVEPGPDADFFFATYVAATRHVTVEKAGAGSGTVADGTGAVNCGTTCSADFRNGDTVTFTATPAGDSTFGGWAGACSGTAPSCSLTVAADATVTATFLQKRATLKVRRVGAGTVRSRPGGIACGRKCSFAFAPGTVALTARAAAHWRFARWQGACHGTKPACRATLAAGTASTVTAVFAKKAKRRARLK